MGGLGFGTGTRVNNEVPSIDVVVQYVAHLLFFWVFDRVILGYRLHLVSCVALVHSIALVLNPAVLKLNLPQCAWPGECLRYARPAYIRVCIGKLCVACRVSSYYLSFHNSTRRAGLRAP